MPRKRGGELGHKHRLQKKDALAVFVDGTLCPFCHRPMHKWQELELDHAIPRALGGIDGPVRLAHKRCNQRAGQSLGGKMRWARRRVVRRKRKRSLPSNPGRW